MLSPLLGQIVWLNGKKGNHYSTGLLRLPPQVEVTGCPLLCQAAPQTARLWQAGGKSLGLLQITDSCFRGWWVSRWPLLAPYEPYFSLLPIHVRVGCPRWPQPLVSLRVTAEQGKSFPGLRDENFRLWAPTRTSCVGSLPSSPPFFFFFWTVEGTQGNWLVSVLSYSECIAIRGSRFMRMWGGFLLDSPSGVSPGPYVLPQSTLGCDTQSLRTGWAHVLSADSSLRSHFTIPESCFPVFWFMSISSFLAATLFH